MSHGAGPPAVLIACAPEDMPAVRGLSQRLRIDGMAVRLLGDLPENQRALPHSLRAALRDVAVVLIALSRRSSDTEGAPIGDIGRLIDVITLMPQRRPLVVLKLARCATPAALGEVDTVELFGYSGYEQLIRLLRERAGRARAVAAPEQPPPAPPLPPALSLRGRFGPPEHVRHGFIRRLGRGVPRAVALLDSRRLLIVAGGGATLLDMRDNAPIWTIDCPTYRSALSRDQRLLALADLDRITVWDLSDGHMLAQCVGHDGPVSGLAFSSNELTLFSTGRDGTLRLWRVNPDATPTGVALAAFAAHNDAITSLALHPDGSLIATGSADRSVRIWRSLDRSLVRTLSNHGGSVESLAFSPDGTLLATGARDRSARLFDTRHWVLRHTLDRHNGAVERVAFSPDGASLASGATDQMIFLWRAADGAMLQSLSGHSGPITGLSFSPDSAQIASVAEDERLIVWNCADGARISMLRPFSGRVTAMALSDDGGKLAIGAADGATAVYGPESEAPPQTRYEDHRGAVQTLAFATGNRLISTAADRTVRACKMDQDESAILLQVHGAFQASALSPDGQLLANSDGEQTVQLWRLSQEHEAPGGTFLRVLRGLNSRPQLLLFAPKAAALAVACENQRIAVWRFTARSSRDTPDLELSSDIGRIRALTFSPDGMLVAAGGVQGGAQIWRLTDGAPIRLPGAIGEIYSLAFSPDGLSLAAGDGRGRIAIWRLTAGARRRSNGPSLSIVGHAGHVTHLCFLPTDGTLISGGGDGTVRMWRV
ncbi:MAG: WD40 repeat domain-containing protein [Oscillochloris sp.]|nr:WD40 repeat domain-containing protein [Oscillochloris sp.]